MDAKQKSNAELAEVHRLSTGLVWWRAVQQMQMELRKVLRDSRMNTKTLTEYVMEHPGSGEIPPPLTLHLPIVAPGLVADAIAGMQAFAIEIILKGATWTLQRSRSSMNRMPEWGTSESVGASGG